MTVNLLPSDFMQDLLPPNFVQIDEQGTIVKTTDVVSISLSSNHTVKITLQSGEFIETYNSIDRVTKHVFSNHTPKIFKVDKINVIGIPDFYWLTSPGMEVQINQIQNKSFLVTLGSPQGYVTYQKCSYRTYSFLNKDLINLVKATL